MAHHVASTEKASGRRLPPLVQQTEEEREHRYRLIRQAYSEGHSVRTLASVSGGHPSLGVHQMVREPD